MKNQVTARIRAIQIFIVTALLLSLGAFIWNAVPDQAEAYELTPSKVHIEKVKNFQVLSQLMHEKKLPLLLAITASHCPYCLQLEDEFLRPMILSGEYNDQILIRELVIDLHSEVIDFDGKKISNNQFTTRYNANMTPTMIFIDEKGKEVAEKIVGINTPNLFGAYIDIEITKALAKVKGE
ncbi:MAG: thioredoxin fold domain-containing protein [Thiotrichaceae bacterium]|nr:thioredoxin fold domain-containing protein [Thiotrichaceae bacterium]